MRNLLLIIASVALPVASIGAFTWSALLRLRDGEQAGTAPDVLFGIGLVLLVPLAACVLTLQREYARRRARRADGG